MMWFSPNTALSSSSPVLTINTDSPAQDSPVLTISTDSHKIR